MSDPAASLYTDVPYEGYPFPQSHPERLATISSLLGMTPASPDHCRVLEIGCGEGENIAPMAYASPSSQFTGIDLSETQLARGREAIAALGLKNLKLHAMDVRELSPGFGTFDYIIAHGVYTWVPADVQQKILSVCKQNLAPNGVAYVSYCCYPGGRIREMVRDILLFHTQNISEPHQKIEQAVALGALIAKAGRGDDSYRLVLAEDLECATSMEGSVLFHDELAPHVSHLYFQQFACQANQHGLDFLAEADYHEMQYRTWPEDVVELLEGLAQRDVVLKEQYLDFFKCRRFRQTLLCHAGVPIHRDPPVERVVDLYAATSAVPSQPTPEVGPGVVVEFRGLRGGRLATDHPLSKAAMIALRSAWPQAVSFRELLAEARKRLHGGSGQDSGVDEEAMVTAEILLRGYESGIVELHSAPLPFTTKVSDRPRASGYARWQLESRTSVTTLRHTTLNVDDALARHLIQLLDGTSDRAAIVAELTPMVTAGLVALKDEGRPVADGSQAARILEQQLERKLEQLARLGLLEA